MNNVTTVFALLLIVSTISPATARTKFTRDADTEHRIYLMLDTVDKLIAQNRYIDARAVLEQAARFDPSANSGVVHERLSLVYKHFGNLEQAITQGLIAYKFDPSLQSLPLDIAMEYKELGRPNDAIEWAQRYLQDSHPDTLWRTRAEDFISDVRKRQQTESRFDANSPDYIDQLSQENQLHPWAAYKFPLKLYIADGKGVAGYQPTFRQRAVDAMNTWVSASGGRIAYILVDNPRNADLSIAWTNDDLKPDEKTKFMETSGLTHYPVVTKETNWHILKSTISIKTVNAMNNEPVDDETVKATVLHELGHALGITGHSTNINDIMYYADSSRRLPGLTKRDKATIMQLYAGYPVLAPPTTQSLPYPPMSRQR